MLLGLELLNVSSRISYQDLCRVDVRIPLELTEAGSE